MRRFFVNLGAAVVALCCNGCSFVFTSGPPDDAAQYPPEKPMDCSTSVAPPVIDTVVAAYQAVRVGVAANLEDSDYDSDAPIDRKADIALGASLFTVFALSAGWGYLATSDCSDAKEAQLRRRVRAHPPARRLVR